MLFFIYCIVLLSHQSINAQCVEHIRDNGTDNGINNVLLGQTFIACEDGDVTSISVTATSNGGTEAGTYELYIAVDPGSGTPPIPTTVAATLILASAPTSLQVLTFNLNTPFSVLDNGTLYRFMIQNITTSDTDMRYTGNEYTGGEFIGESGTSYASFDLDFEVNIQPSSSSPADVPTLSEWGLLILALSFMILGTLYLVQPKFRGSFEQE